MRGFIVLCLCATVLAAPQGYNYNRQQQNSLPIALPNFSVQTQTASKTQESHGFLQEAVKTGSLQQALLGGQITQSTQQFSTAPKFPQYQPTKQQTVGFGNLQQQQQQQLQPPFLGNFGGQPQQQFNNAYQQQYQAPNTVTKDIYVHVAPEDVEDQQYHQPALPPPPPRKHYRIVFIKAPSQNINKAALRIQQAPTEEKTIIYVLTKKQDPLDLQAALQDVQPKPPSKPEVYFIKYKTQEEAQHAQRTIQAQYDQLGGTSQVSDEGIAPVASVIGSLDGQKPSGLDFSNGSSHSSTSSSFSTTSSSSATSSSSNSLTSGTTVNNGSKYLPPIIKL
ncbi:uncharacterized protein ACRADG_012115 [Cochliomyia hominivorax]